jgi:regulator of protease activity HflC (stomatin/prohibitin superfamily)
MSDGAFGIVLIVVVLLLCVFGIGGGCIGYPQYKVYQQRMEGEAKLKESESSRLIQVEDAKAKEQASRLLANAEVERAKGVAEANRIIGDSLKNHPEYLTYLWIKEVNADGNAVIYVPTEAGLPILEAGRGMPARKGSAKDEPAKAEPKK